MIKSKENIKNLNVAHGKLGSPKTYFFKKTSANVSKEKYIEECAKMMQFVIKIKHPTNQ